MNTQADSNVKFYQSIREVGVLEPYAVISSYELDAVIKRFVAMASMIATHPKIAETFGEISTAPIRLATDLRNAIKVSEESGLYPNVVLPKDKFKSAMKLMGITRASELKFHEMIAQENQRWAEDFPS